MSRRSVPRLDSLAWWSRSLWYGTGPAPSRGEAALWALVVLALVADLALTARGLGAGHSEANPFARLILDRAGLVGFAVLKGFAVTFALTVRVLVPERFAPLVPATLFVPWSAAALVNLAVLTLV